MRLSEGIPVTAGTASSAPGPNAYANLRPCVSTASVSASLPGMPCACSAADMLASYTPMPPGVRCTTWKRMVNAVTAAAAVSESSRPSACAAP